METVLDNPPKQSWYKSFLVTLLALMLPIAIIYFLLFSPFADRYKTINYIRYHFANSIFNVHEKLGYSSVDKCKFYFQPIRPVMSKQGDGYTYMYVLEGKLIDINLKILFI